MLPLQFFGQNIHFAINLFAALVFFAVFWLYFDAWGSGPRKTRKDILKWGGFLVVSISFVLEATIIDESMLGRSVFGSAAGTIATLVRLAGYLAIIIGQIIDPLQTKPKTSGLTAEVMTDLVNGEKKVSSASAPAKNLAVLSTGNSFGLVFALPIGAAIIAWQYYRRATKGLERHLKPVAIAFGLLVGFELLSLAGLLHTSTNPNIYNLVKAFGPLWIGSQFFLLSAVVVLARWVWRYLTERFLSQLFMIFVSMIMGIFLVITLSFTFLLTRNVQNDALGNLQTATKVLNYALDAKRAETNANAEMIAQDPQISQAIITKDHKTLASLTDDFLSAKKQSGLVLTTSSGQVVLRAENPEHWGDSLSSDTLIQRALVGETTSSIGTSESVLAPVISIKTTVPVRDTNKNIVGTATVSLVVDNALADGIKKPTGLDSSIYSGDLLSSTTLVSPDGKSRQIGIRQTNKAVTTTVLEKGQTYKGVLNIQGRQYLAVYTPLKDADNTIVGMLFIGQPQASILHTAGHSIELTFLVAVLLLISSVAPAYLVARQLSRQLE